MTKEDIITTAIREAFLCGKEAGEESQRQWRTMQDKIDAAKQGKPDHDLHMYDGIFSQFSEVRIDEESALNPDNKEVTFQVMALQGQRIGDTPEEKIAMLSHQCRLLKQENLELQKQCEEKDATITELRAELQARLQATVPVGSPTGKEPSPCIYYSEGDQVLVSGKFFGDYTGYFQGTILEVMKDNALVLITEKDSDFEDEEHNIPYEYITKQ